jgi:hypothetical protein
VTLTELEPRWVTAADAPAEAQQGVSFLCPHCAQVRLAIFFDVPILFVAPVDLDAVHRQQAEFGHLADHHIGRILWHREGDTFEDLTLTPSVDASHVGHWHGFITHGEIT